MESGRVPLPTARHTLPNVGSPRGQRPGVDPRAHAQIDSLLWRGELGDREIRIQLVRHVRRQNIRDISQVTTAPPHARQTHGNRLGQRPIPPRQVTRAVVAKASQGADPPIPAAVQPAVGADRASLETDPTLGHPQPILRDAWRGAGRCRAVLRTMAKAQLSAETIMRHYLRRYV